MKENPTIEHLPGLKDLYSFVEKYTNKDGSIHKKYFPWYEILLNIKKIENRDPVEFLRDFYHKEGKSVEDLEEYISENNIEKHYSETDTLARFLKNILEFELREALERTKHSKEKSKKTKNTIGIAKSNSEMKKNGIEEFLDFLKENNIEINNILEKNFSLKTKMEKLNFLLNGNLENILKNARGKGFGYKKIANGFSALLKEKNIDLIITHTDIRYFLQKIN